MRRRWIFERTQQRVAAVVALAESECGREASAPRGALRRTPAGPATCTLLLAGFTLLMALAGCAVGPDYIPEPAPAPQTFKELKGWKSPPRSTISTAANGGAIYRDPKTSLSCCKPGRNLQPDGRRRGRQLTSRRAPSSARRKSALFPTVTASYTYTRTRAGPKGRPAAEPRVPAPAPRLRPGRRHIHDNLRAAASPAPGIIDVWGNIRRTIESQAAGAQASAGIDLADAKLSAQSSLATAYFELRETDFLHDLLAGHRRAVHPFAGDHAKQESRLHGGAIRRDHRAGARVLRASAGDQHRRLARAQFEHAIAVLMGRPPSGLSIPALGR